MNDMTSRSSRLNASVNRVTRSASLSRSIAPPPRPSQADFRPSCERGDKVTWRGLSFQHGCFEARDFVGATRGNPLATEWELQEASYAETKPAHHRVRVDRHGSIRQLVTRR